MTVIFSFEIWPFAKTLRESEQGHPAFTTYGDIRIEARNLSQMVF
jgi:hypothetical protein